MQRVVEQLKEIDRAVETDGRDSTGNRRPASAPVLPLPTNIVYAEVTAIRCEVVELGHPEPRRKKKGRALHQRPGWLVLVARERPQILQRVRSRHSRAAPEFDQLLARRESLICA